MNADLEKLAGKDREIAWLATRRGLDVNKIGRVWHINGPRIDIRTARLSYLSPSELVPGGR